MYKTGPTRPGPRIIRIPKMAEDVAIASSLDETSSLLRGPCARFYAMDFFFIAVLKRFLVEGCSK